MKRARERTVRDALRISEQAARIAAWENLSELLRELTVLVRVARGKVEAEDCTAGRTSDVQTGAHGRY